MSIETLSGPAVINPLEFPLHETPKFDSKGGGGQVKIYKEYAYGPGNPLPLVDLEERGSDVTKTPQYIHGRELFKSGQTPVKDAGFLQIMALDAGEDNEVACISRDIRWDSETDIREFGTALARAIVGQNLDPTWYGNLQFTMYFEGDLDPEELVKRMVYSPQKLYEQYMPHLLDEAIEDEKIYEETFLGEGSKGQKFVDIFNGTESGQISAYQEQSGRGFVWGYREVEDRILEGISPTKEKSTVRKMALDEHTEPAMRDNLLDDEKRFTGVKKVRRWAVKFTVDVTRPCCLYATASQSEVLFNKTDQFRSGSKVLQSETDKLFSDLVVKKSKSRGVSHSSYDKNNSKCRSCGRDKYGEEEERCDCSKQEQKDNKKSN